jgi:medium-chain acyl-[acyl-carrier-protein] hydrolase
VRARLSFFLKLAAFPAGRAQGEFHALVRDLAAAVAPALRAGSSGGASTSAAPAAAAVPYALLGHSFGAWLAFELARALPEQPLALYASANRAPALAAAAHDPDPLGARIAALPPAAFWPRFEGRYGRNPELQSPAVRAFLHPILAADFACLEGYDGPSDDDDGPQLTCPLTATGAEGDARYTRAQVAAWARHTRGEFALRWETPPAHAWATPHRFLADAPAPFQAFLADDLARLLALRERQAAHDGSA